MGLFPKIRVSVFLNENGIFDKMGIFLENTKNCENGILEHLDFTEIQQNCIIMLKSVFISANTIRSEPRIC